MVADVRRRYFLVGSPDLPYHHDRPSLLIFLEQGQEFGERRARDHVAADPDAGGLAYPVSRQLVHRLVGIGGAPRHQSDGPYGIDPVVHEADLAASRRDDAERVRPNDHRVGKGPVEVVNFPHVPDRYALGDGHDQFYTGLELLKNRAHVACAGTKRTDALGALPLTASATVS
jgi:hypothetical protein